MSPRKSVLAIALLALLAGASAGAQTRLSEADFYEELPVVLSVSRLAQPLNEAPGAVTVIDRETIRRSGARELTDVLRLVPGYLIGGLNAGNLSAAYHAPIDDYGVRNLILIDGRAVYSSIFIGGTHRGIRGVLLEDIERIEVLRGSNSASLGANAMFGVINIITRHAADTHGGAVSITGGSGLHDGYARIGWGETDASFRLSVGRRSDDSGYSGVRDDYRVDQFHLRGDFRPAADQEAMFSLSGSELAAFEGFPDTTGNPERGTRWRDVALHGHWRRQLSPTDEIKLTANFDEENIRDRSPYGRIPDVFLDYGGRGRRTDLELQHQMALGNDWKVVWGLGVKSENAKSSALFDARSPVSFSERRLFGNAQWRPNAYWTINAGTYLGRHSEIGTYAAPRLMANLHLTPEHTLRLGATRSLRTPTLFELNADVRYYQRGVLIGRTYTATGNVREERMLTREFGYFGNLRDWRLTVDVRVFDEQMQDSIETKNYALPAAEAALLATGRGTVKDYINDRWMRIRGAEYQLRWKPRSETELWLNQTWLETTHQGGSTNHTGPAYATTLAWFERLPLDLNFTLMLHSFGKLTWRDTTREHPAQRRVDARLALPFRMEGMKAEAALVASAANGDFVAFFPYDQHRLIETRRLFGTLRFEF